MRPSSSSFKKSFHSTLGHPFPFLYPYHLFQSLPHIFGRIPPPFFLPPRNGQPTEQTFNFHLLGLEGN
ncbi:unnamed protein product [Meloidogyne enterolobii]|uniref:Uncharacterized protein n=1 Tax=Meloidogyne enterolobii TaxID=390850 RepID=A0ACB0ZPL2_MELEN